MQLVKTTATVIWNMLVIGRHTEESRERNTCNVVMEKGALLWTKKLVSCVMSATVNSCVPWSWADLSQTSSLGNQQCSWISSVCKMLVWRYTDAEFVINPLQVFLVAATQESIILILTFLGLPEVVSFTPQTCACGCPVMMLADSMLAQFTGWYSLWSIIYPFQQLCDHKPNSVWLLAG